MKKVVTVFCVFLLIKLDMKINMFIQTNVNRKILNHRVRNVLKQLKTFRSFKKRHLSIELAI